MDIINKSKEIINGLKEKFLKHKENNKTTEQKNVTKTNLTISDKQKNILTKLATSRKTQEDIKLRAALILMYDEKRNTDIVAKEFNTYWDKANKWVKRYVENYELLDKTELQEPHRLKRTIISVLSDKYRSGRILTFSSIQIACIIFLSLQDPKQLGLPISNWSAELLKHQVIKMNIVTNISSRQISRYLSEMNINVYRYQGWLNSIEKNKNFEEFKAKIAEISEIYEKSEELSKQGVLVTCSDEKMSIQALEHKHEKKPVKMGSKEKIEQEYKRHGTTGVIATREVSTGKIIVADIQPTRTEEDYVNHIKQVVTTHPSSRIILIMDQLNTHMSEGMVKLIAAECNIQDDLGIKGVSGILKSMESRKKFLEDPNHSIRIVYTPKHTSWMNQIEIWFGIMTKQLLNKRSSFKSIEELETQIRKYIDYYNQNLAKKFKWNSGKILNM